MKTVILNGLKNGNRRGPGGVPRVVGGVFSLGAKKGGGRVAPPPAPFLREEGGGDPSQAEVSEIPADPGGGAASCARPGAGADIPDARRGERRELPQPLSRGDGDRPRGRGNVR